MTSSPEVLPRADRSRPPLLSHVRAFATAALALSALSAQAQTTPYEEVSKSIRAPNAVAKIGVDLFGDQENLYTGRLEFVQMDVSLPGNSTLPVAVGRHLTTAQASRGQHAFGRWDLEIPHMHGMFSRRDGWKSASGTNARCTNFGSPPDALGDTGTGHWEAKEFWQGNFLYVPGQGSQQVLRRATDNTAAPGGAVSTYPLVTSKFWSISCLPTLANSTTQGEGFLAIAPDGTTYRFDQLISYAATTLYKPAGTSFTSGSEDGSGKESWQSGGPAPFAPVDDLMSRKEVWLLPTVITDRYGNTVRYTYDTVNPEKLLTITGSDGRVLQLYYNDPVSPKVITSVSDGTRTWYYTYRTSGLDATRDLDRVTLPDGSSWQLSGTDPFFIEVDFLSGPSCELPAYINPWQQTGTMQHPSGTTGSFTLTPTTHGRSDVMKDCRYTADGADYPLIPRYFYTYALTNKTLTGPALPGLSWNYSYGSPNASWSPCGAGCPTTKTVTVTDPRGDSTLYTFGNVYRVSEGQLQRVDTGWNGSSALSTKTMRYRAPGAGPYPETAGYGSYNIGDGDAMARHMPMDQQLITQQGVTFLWEATAFDTFVRPTVSTRASSLGYSRTETTAYSDHSSKWILGQIASVTEASTSKVMESNTYNPTTATLTTTSKFGLLQQTMTYNTDGTVASRKDGRNYTTTYSNYKAGIPQSVSYPDATSESAVVNSLGQVVSLTNAAGTTTSLEYDPVGRLKRISYPAADTVAWNATTLTAEQVFSPEYGLPPGHWRQTVSTGNSHTITYLDGLWRPVLTRTFDLANEAGTRRMTLRRFDFNSNPVFESYAQRTINDIGENPAGASTAYDALGRVTSETAASELGNLTTTISYLGNFTKQVTNPRGHTTTLRFMAFDQPVETLPVRIEQPYSIASDINRDVFGNPNYIIRGNGSEQASRQYVYDAYMRLCKTIEPESGATVQAYDAASNVIWRASGQGLPSNTSCDTASVPASQKINHGYDALNRLTSTTFGDVSPSITQTYTPDGLPLANTSNGAVWTNQYNKRRLLTQETLNYGGKTYAFVRDYDANGSSSQLTYPGTPLLSVAYSLNALGEPGQVSNYASSISYYPNGAIAGFTYANGITHSMTQNTRGLPQQVIDTGVLNDVYSYDANGNVTSIADLQQGISSRSMGYDNIDRLSSATASGLWGTASFGYDAIDNLTSTTVSGGGTARTSTYNIHYPSNRVTNISSTNAQYSLSYGYDARGNVTQRGSQAFVFDIGNHLSSATGKASYAYDGRGRRIKTARADGSSELTVYTQDGKLLYGESVAGGVTTQNRYVYLSGTLLAQPGVSYVHTDGLGSVVARTDSARTILSRTYYEPYGLTAAGAQPTIGFAGHVNDANTGLTYMQQRYYDPVAGRFSSVDPVAANVTVGTTFNRYVYANNSPYRYIDPDGRVAVSAEVCLGKCVGLAMGYRFDSGEFAVIANYGSGLGGGASIDLRPNENGRAGSSEVSQGNGASVNAYAKAGAELKTPLGSVGGGAKAVVGTVLGGQAIKPEVSKEFGVSGKNPGLKMGAGASVGVEVAGFINLKDAAADAQQKVMTNFIAPLIREMESRSSPRTPDER